MVSASCTVGLVAVALVHCLSSAVFLQGPENREGGTNSLDTEHLVEGGPKYKWLRGESGEQRNAKKALTLISEIIPFLRKAYEDHDFTALDKKIDECAANGLLGSKVSFDILDPLNLGKPYKSPEQNAYILKSGVENLVLHNNTFGLSEEAVPLVRAIDSFLRTGDTKGLIQVLLDNESPTGDPLADLFAPFATTTAAPKKADDPFAGLFGPPNATAAPKKADDPFAGLFGPPKTTAAPKKADDPFAGLFAPPKTTAAPKKADDPVRKSELEAAFAKASDGDTGPLKNLMTRMFRPGLQSYLEKDIDALFPPEDPFADLFGPKAEPIADLFGPKNSTAVNSTAQNASDPIAGLLGSLFGPKSRRAALPSH